MHYEKAQLEKTLSDILGKKGEIKQQQPSSTIVEKKKRKKKAKKKMVRPFEVPLEGQEC